MKFEECSGADFADAVRQAWQEGGTEKDLADRIVAQIEETAGHHSAEYVPLVEAGESYYGAVREARSTFLSACRAAIREQEAINARLDQRLGLASSAEEPAFNAESPAELSERFQQLALWYGAEIEGLQARFRDHCSAFEEECMQHYAMFQQAIVASYERRGITRTILDNAAVGELPPEGEAARAVVAAYTAALVEVGRMAEAVWQVVEAAPRSWTRT